ncbi:MAG: alanine racemase [Clostridia bacterium]
MLRTPLTLIDKEKLKNNINRMQMLCDKNGKKLMPMMKTHKSSYIAKMQLKAGAYGFLCGTIDECELAYSISAKNIMYAYPVSSKVNIMRLAALTDKANIILRTDSKECADIANDCARVSGKYFNMTVIIDSGLHRFGLSPENCSDLGKYISSLSNMKLIGISTHPGHVYAGNADDVTRIALEEAEYMKRAKESFVENGLPVEYVTSGSTPTMSEAVKSPHINIFHPGNYVFYDYIQMKLGIATEDQCALTVLAGIISHPGRNTFICDAGAKCLGLDKGAHGNSAIDRYGYIKGNSNAKLISLSEEVGLIKCENDDEFMIGEQIEIIPNHSCSAANLTGSFYDRKTNTFIPVDARGNTKQDICIM